MADPTVAGSLGSIGYPGRGLVLAHVGGAQVVVYFLTGRSDASRARMLTADPDGSIAVTGVSDAGPDPLRHYRAVRRAGRLVVVGNGDHVDFVLDSLAEGVDPAGIMDEISAEPDPPIWTPRIWLASQPGQPVLVGSARRRGDAASVRTLWRITGLQDREAVLLTTYVGSRFAVKVSSGLTECTTPSRSSEGLLDEVWEALNPELRVAAASISPGNPSGQTLFRSEL